MNDFLFPDLFHASVQPLPLVAPSADLTARHYEGARAVHYRMCPSCGRLFVARLKRAKFCSQSCFGRVNRQQQLSATPSVRPAIGSTVSCPKCGSDVVATETRVKHGKYVCSDCQRQESRGREKNNAIYRQRYAENLEASRKKAREYRRQARQTAVGRMKQLAREAVDRATKNGRLSRLPCERCGDPRSQGHHEDYSKPLYVIWLCYRCHGLRHREIADARRQELIRQGLVEPQSCGTRKNARTGVSNSLWRLTV